MVCDPPPGLAPPALILALPPELEAAAGLSVAPYTLFDLSCCTLLDIISVLPEGTDAAPAAGTTDELPLVNPEDVVALFPLENQEDELLGAVVALLPLVNPEELDVLGETEDDLDPLEKLLEPLENPLDLPPPPPPPPLASTKLALTTNKLITIANHSDFLNMLCSFHFCCLSEFLLLRFELIN
jgi:hypothetical protein